MENRAALTAEKSRESLSSTAAHTPGPWQTHWETDVTGYPAFYIHGMSGLDKRNVPALNANARLIAAAPDLLEAIRQYITLIDSSENRRMGAMDKARRRMRAALAKATGAA